MLTEGVSHHGFFFFASNALSQGLPAPSWPSIPAISMGEDSCADIRSALYNNGVVSVATTIYGCLQGRAESAVDALARSSSSATRVEQVE
jgi:hypothetical protein